MSSYHIVVYRGQALPKEYRGFVFAHWKKSLRSDNDYFRLVDPSAYFTAYGDYTERIVGDPECRVRVAVLEDNKDVALGFSVSRGTKLDYIYVKNSCRHEGIGTALIPPDIQVITHLTKTGLTIWGSKYGQWKFNPFT